MKKSLLTKLTNLAERYQELSDHLSQAGVIANQERYQAYAKEYAQLEDVVIQFKRFQKNLVAIEHAQALLADDDAELKSMANEEIEALTAEQAKLEQSIQTLLLPVDPNDECDVFLEIRAGAGGNEAAIFAGDLLRMYSRLAENNRWQVHPISEHFGEHGGYKEVIVRIAGKGVYSRLKFESGAHRVQRVPVTESQGRIHTSTCTVAVLPEVKEVEKIDINPTDLRIDTYRSSGAGGQHVNTTESAIRITHIPTGTVVECQDERSQHKNRARAMSLLQAKILDQERTRQRQAQAATRKSLVGTGDRSERIRTYNFPQGRVTDHRINLTLYKLDQVMEGDLDDIIDALIREHQADQLAQLSDN